MFIKGVRIHLLCLSFAYFIAVCTQTIYIPTGNVRQGQSIWLIITHTRVIKGWPHREKVTRLYWHWRHVNIWCVCLSLISETRGMICPPCIQTGSIRNQLLNNLQVHIHILYLWPRLQVLQADQFTGV